MERTITIIGKNGVEYTLPLTTEVADYCLRLALWRSRSADEVMKTFSDLLLQQSTQNEHETKARYN